MDNNLLQTQIGSGFLVVWLIQRAKAAGWLPFITQQTAGLNRFLSAVAATLATVGITVHYDPTGGVLTLSGLTLANLIPFLSTLLSQGAIQELLYQAGFKVKPASVAPPATP